MQTTESRIELTLSRFPGPLKFYPSPVKWLLIGLVSAVFAASGVWMVSIEADRGWLVLIFFALCLAVSAIMLLPGAGGLVLDAEGFVATSLFRSHRFRWRDVNGFEPISVSRQRMVGFDDVTGGRTIGAINTALAGRNAALPDTYGFSADELAELMQRWRDRATGA
jgi:hypothetical protein